MEKLSIRHGALCEYLRYLFITHAHYIPVNIEYTLFIGNINKIEECAGLSVWRRECARAACHKTQMPRAHRSHLIFRHYEEISTFALLSTWHIVGWRCTKSTQKWIEKMPFTCNTQFMDAIQIERGNVHQCATRLLTTMAITISTDQIDLKRFFVISICRVNFALFC